MYCPVYAAMEIPARCKIGSKVSIPSPKRNRKKSRDQKKIMKSDNDLAKKNRAGYGWKKKGSFCCFCAEE